MAGVNQPKKEEITPDILLKEAPYIHARSTDGGVGKCNFRDNEG
jgi:hypothetical protein